MVTFYKSEQLKQALLPWLRNPVLMQLKRSPLRDFQRINYPTISCGISSLARPMNWEGAYAHPTILDNLFVGVPLNVGIVWGLNYGRVR